MLYCTIDTRLWSAEGTEEVRQEKATDVALTLTRLNEKGNLSKTQEAYARRLSSTLDRLNNSFARPSKPCYQGKPNIVAGLSLAIVLKVKRKRGKICALQMRTTR